MLDDENATAVVRHTPNESERGFVLVVSVVVTTVLALLGYLMMQSVAIDAQMAYADRQGQSALAVANAGIGWAMERLSETHGFIDSTNYDGVLADLTELTCNSGESDDIECPDEISGWREMHPEAEKIWYPTGNAGDSVGWFRVVLKDDQDYDDDFSEDANDTLLIRSYAVTNEGSRRMVEVAVTGQ